jgi:proline racemase/trans-L-3-hydroxyproline dehydratase
MAMERDLDKKKTSHSFDEIINNLSGNLSKRKGIEVADLHTEGEPARIILRGWPEIPGETIEERFVNLVGGEKFNRLRNLLMREPRGHQNMFGAILLPPINKEADVGVIYMDTSEFLYMCGHATMAIATLLVEGGWIKQKEAEPKVLLETPAGLIEAKAKIGKGKIKRVVVKDVPSFKWGTREIKTQRGELRVDIVFGGNFFGIVSAEEAGINLRKEGIKEARELGMELLEKLKRIRVSHPTKPYIDSIQLVEFFGEAQDPRADKKNLVIFSKGEVDRSPCGTGTCALMAKLFSEGKLKVGDSFVQEGILGTKFKGRILEEIEFDGFKAIIPEVGGTAYITAMSTLYLDKSDPFQSGFLLEH